MNGTLRSIGHDWFCAVREHFCGAPRCEGMARPEYTLTRVQRWVLLDLREWEIAYLDERPTEQGAWHKVWPMEEWTDERRDYFVEDLGFSEVRL